MDIEGFYGILMDVDRFVRDFKWLVFYGIQGILKDFNGFKDILIEEFLTILCNFKGF